MQACYEAFCRASGYTPYLVTSSPRQRCPFMLFCISSIFLCWEIAWVPLFWLPLFSCFFFVLPCQAVLTAMPFFLCRVRVPLCSPSYMFYFICFNPCENSMSPNDFSLLLPHFCDFAHPFSLLIADGLLFVRLSAVKLYLGDRWKRFSLFFSCINKIDA